MFFQLGENLLPTRGTQARLNKPSDAALIEEPLKWDYIIVVDDEKRADGADKPITACFGLIEQAVPMLEEGDPGFEKQHYWRNVNDYEEVIAALRQLKLHVKVSRVPGKVFLTVGAPEKLLLEYAEKFRTEVELEPGKGEEAMRLLSGGASAFVMEEWDNYKMQDETGTVLKASQRQELIMAAIRAHRFGKRLDLLKRSGTILAMMPVPEEEPRRTLMEQWAKSFFSWQPITAIRDYFGEQIAFYFAFLGHYTAWLIFPAVLGIIVIIEQFLSYEKRVKAGKIPDYDSPYDGKLTAPYCFILSIWGILMIEFWKRRSITLAHAWSVTEFEEQERFREDFRFTADKLLTDSDIVNLNFDLPLKVNPTSQRQKHYPFIRRVFDYAISLPTIFVLICSVAGALVGAQILRASIDHPSWYMSLGLGQLNTFILLVFNIMYAKISVLCNDLENHTTDTEHENALIVKTFLFQFVNSYGALFIISFWPYPMDSPQSLKRMQQLFFQFLSIQITKSVMSTVKEVIVPAFKRRMKERAAENAGTDTSSMEEREFLKEEYSGTFDDYAEIAIQFGYVMMFAAAFPLGALIALVNNFFEIRTDAFKIVEECRRPFAKQAENIGAWFGVFDALVLIGIVSNALFLSITSYSLTLFYDVPLDYLNRFSFFMGAEHILFAVAFFLKFAVPDVPLQIRKRVAAVRYLQVKKLFESQTTKGKKMGNVVEIDFTQEFLKPQTSLDSVQVDVPSYAGEMSDIPPMAVSGPLMYRV